MSIPICIICQESICENVDDDVNGNDNNGDDFPVSTRCGHIYHNSCIRRWFDSATAANRNEGTRCPYCKKCVCQNTGLSRIYPVTERDVKIPLQNPFGLAAGEVDDAGFDQICLFSKRNDGLAEEIQCLQEILGSTEHDNQVLRLKLKGVQDELLKVKVNEAGLSRKVELIHETYQLDNNNIRLELKSVQDELALVKSSEAKLKLQMANLKAIVVQDDSEPTNPVISPTPQHSPSTAASTNSKMTNCRPGLDLGAASENAQTPPSQPKPYVIPVRRNKQVTPASPISVVPEILTATNSLEEPSFHVGQLVVWENNLKGQVRCLLQDVGADLTFVGVEFDKPPTGGMSGCVGTLQLFSCKKDHGLMLLASALRKKNPTSPATESASEMSWRRFVPMVPDASAMLERFQLGDFVQCGYWQTNGNIYRKVAGKIKCRLVDIATSEIIVGVQNDREILDGFSGEMGNVWLFFCPTNHAGLFRANEIRLHNPIK